MEMREELKFFASFPKKLEQFRGKHVAMIGRGVVASGDSAKEVFEKAREEYPEKMPVLAFIEKGSISASGVLEYLTTLIFAFETKPLILSEKVEYEDNRWNTGI